MVKQQEELSKKKLALLHQRKSSAEIKRRSYSASESTMDDKGGLSTTPSRKKSWFRKTRSQTLIIDSKQLQKKEKEIENIKLEIEKEEIKAKVSVVFIL